MKQTQTAIIPSSPHFTTNKTDEFECRLLLLLIDGCFMHIIYNRQRQMRRTKCVSIVTV